MDAPAHTFGASGLIAAALLFLAGVAICLTALAALASCASHRRGPYVAYAAMAFCAAMGCGAAASAQMQGIDAPASLTALRFLFIPVFAWFFTLQRRPER